MGLPSSALLSAMTRRVETLTPTGGARILAVVLAVYSLGYAGAGLLLTPDARTGPAIACALVTITTLLVILTDTARISPTPPDTTSTATASDQ